MIYPFRSSLHWYHLHKHNSSISQESNLNGGKFLASILTGSLAGSIGWRVFEKGWLGQPRVYRLKTGLV